MSHIRNSVIHAKFIRPDVKQVLIYINVFGGIIAPDSVVRYTPGPQRLPYGVICVHLHSKFFFILDMQFLATL